MTILEQLRIENPNLALIPDEELLQKLLLEYQGDLDPDVYMQSLMGEEPVVSPVQAPVLGGKRALAPTSNVNDIGFGQAFTGPAKSSWARSWGPSITRLKGGIAALSGNEDRAQELYSQAQQEDRGILQNSGYVSFAQATEGPDAGVDTFVKAGLSAIGSSSPFLVEGIAGAVTGAKIGRFAGPVGAAIGAGVGAAVASFPRLFEFNLSRQQEQVSIGNLDTISEGKAALTALPQAALESVMFPVVGKLFGKIGRTEFSNIINRATTGRVAKGTALGVTGEAATEVGQQVLERYQAGLPIDTPEAIAEYKEAAFAGGFVGGAFGGAATLAGEATRAIQPTPTPVEKPVETPVQKPLEAPVVKGGIIQPQQQKDIAKQQAVEEQAKPVNFAVEQQADKFVVKEQSLDANNNIVKTTPLNVFNTQEEAIANQKESQEQKNKVSEQTFFTADEIKTENPTLGNIIDEVELLGNKIAPNVKQVYFQKDLALAKGNESAVKASGGTLGSSVDGWYDRTSDINFISTSNLDNIQETVAHENFHALQRVQNRASGLFTEQEQSALNTFLPGGTIDNINPLVQKALGNDVMTRLRERHLGSEVTPQEMQAYAFGAYTSMKAKGARLAAPNPVIRAFKKFFDFLKGVGNIFRKNKINNVQDLFEQARTGKIGKRAVPKEGIDELRTTSLQKAERAAAKGVTPSVTEPSLSTVSLDDGSQIQSVIPSLVGQIGEKLVKSIYGPKGTIQLRKDFIDSYLTPAQQKAKFGRNDDMKKANTIFKLSKLEQELRNSDGYIMLNNVPKGYERIGFGNKNLTTSYREDKAILERGIKEILPSQQEFALSTVPLRKKPPQKFNSIKALGKFFDDKVKESNPLDKKAYNRALDAADKEIKYQLEKQDTGKGWYDSDVAEMFVDLQQKIPSLNIQENKDLFTIIIGITSPQTTPTENVVKAGRVYSYYEKFGALAIKQPGNELNFGRTTITQQLSLLQYLLDTKGKEGTVDFLNSTHEVRDLDKVLRESGAAKYGSQFTDKTGKKLNYSADSKISGAVRPRNERNEVLGSYLFGNKIGSFYLNISGIADKEGDAVTKDLWAARSFYRQFGQVVDNTKSAQDGLKGAFLPIHRNLGDDFFRELGKRNDLSAKDAQAVLWFYEHELFGDLGINNVPALYLSSGSKKYINNYDKGDNYGTVELENRKPSIEVKNRVGQKKETETTGEVNFSVSEGENKYEFEDKEFSVTDRPGGYKGPIKVSQSIPKNLRKLIREKTGATPKGFAKVYNPESNVKTVQFLVQENLGKSYEGFQSKFQANRMIGIVAANGYRHPEGRSDGYEYFFVEDNNGNLIGAQQVRISKFPKDTVGFEKVSKIPVSSKSVRKYFYKTFVPPEDLVKIKNPRSANYDAGLDERYEEDIDALIEKNREIYDAERNKETSKFFKKALELDVGGSYNVRASEALFQEALNFAKSNNVEDIVLTDVVNEQAKRAFKKRGFKEVKSSSIFYGLITGLTGKKQELNLVAKVSDLDSQIEAQVEQEIAPETIKSDLELSVSSDTAIKDTDVNAFLKSGSDVTSYNPEEYLAAAETRGPLVGHCAACAYVVQKNYGGDVMQVFVPPKKGFNKQREKHYFNKLPDGTFIDLTGEQYGNQSVTPPQDFIGRAKIGPHQWGDSARYKGKLNKRFTDFEEKFNSIKEQDVENTSKNLYDILPPEFSISEDKELLNPSGTDVGANIDVDEFAIFEEILPNPTEVITDSITREKGYAAVRRFVNQRYAEQIKKFGKPVNIPDTNMSTFLFNIYAGRFPVGTGFGVRLGDTGFIDLVELNESETKYLSPSAFRKIGVDLSKQLGVKKFAGIRTTGARLKADAERIEKGLDLVNTRQDNIATSEEFNQEATEEFSVSDLKNQVKKIDPSIKKNTETDVGKLIGGNLYVHKSAENVIDGLNKFKKRLPKDFTYDIVKFDKKENITSFIKSPDWDTAAEPLATTGVRVPLSGPIKDLKINQLYHHKWLFVRDDYKGFDSKESIKRSMSWLPLRKEGKVLDKAGWAAIGRPETWNKVNKFLDRQSMAKSARQRGEGLALPEAKVLQYLDANIARDEDVLSVGAGFANKEKELKDKGFNILAEDTKESGQEKRLNEAGLFEGYKEDFISEGRKFDTVLLSNVINVQNEIEAREELLNQVQQLLKPDGRLIINLPKKPQNPGSPKSNDELRSILEQRYEQVETVRINDKRQSDVFEAKNPRAETASQNLDDILSPEFSISENKNRLDNPDSIIEVDNDPIDALNNYGLGAVFDSSTRLDIPLSDANISKEIAESVQRVKDGKSSYAYGSDKDLLEKYGDPVNVRGSKIPLFSVGFTIDNEIVGSAQGIKLGKTAIIDLVQLRDSENNYISPTGFRTIGFKIAQELGVNKFVGQRITGTRAIKSINENKVFPLVESSEFNTLSQEERIESNLEFSVTDDIVSDAHQSARNKINPKFARTTPVGYWKQYTDNVGIKLQQGIIDQYASIKKYLGDEPYKAATMTYASGGATEAALLYGVPFLDNDGAIDLKEDTLGTGLFTRLEKLGNKLPIFLEYVAGKRAEFLESESKETGFSPEEIQTLISLRNGNEKLFDEGLADLNEFNKAFLDMGLKSGYLSQEAYDTWTGGGGYDFYLPFYRVLQEIGETQGPSAAPSIVNQPEIKKLVGSSRPIQDLLSNIVRNYNFLTEATLKNIAALKALEAGVEQGVTREVPFNERSKNAVFARRNGERVFFEVDEPIVLEALQAMNWGGWQNPAMGALRNFKRYLTLGVTFSPAFRIRNLIRDTIHSIAVGPLTYNPLENVLQGYKTLKKDKRTGLSEMRAKMAFGGGEIHFGHIYGNDPNATKMLLDRAIDVNTVMKSDGWSAGGLKLITGQLKKALRSWNETGSFAENINRAALYKQLRDKGVSHFEASYQARDLLNFSRHGASPIVRFLTQSIPFLNARIQGLDKMGRAMGPEQRTQLITTLGAYSLASIGLYMMFKDDEDFKQREQWDRDTYHWFKFPGSETAFRIPKPFEVGAIGTMAERLVEQIVDDDVHGILFVERLQHMIGETFAFDYRPQLITPAIEVYANKNEFTKRPIEPMWMKRLPATERKYAWTSSAYTFSSKLLNTISFDKIQISPVQIEHLVEGYFGFIGSSIAATVSIVDYPRNLAKITSKDSPLFMGFVKALPSRQSKYKTEFYELLSKMNEAHSLYRNFMRVGNTEDALKVLNKNKNIFAWRGAYTKVNKQLQQISNQIRLVENNKNLSEKEKLDKVRQLNILKNNIIQMIRQQTLDFEKNTGTKVKRPIFWK